MSATLWSAADFCLRQGLQFGVSIALARLVSPEEFGTIALLYLFTGIAGAFVDGGLSAALIQRQDLTHTDESTVFWFNVVMGAIISAGLSAAGPAIARMFATPILAPLTAVMAANIFLSALGSIHGTLLTKGLDFRTQMKVTGFSTAISGAVAIGLAWDGRGVWALAMQTVIATAVTTVVLWSVNRWRPGFVFSRASARRLFGFGIHMLAASLLEVAYARVYTLLIGKFYGVRELGFYSRADSTKQLPVSVLTGILSRVAFPIFSAAAHDKQLLRRGVQLALRSMMLLNVPMMLGLIAVAEPLVLTLFGVRWLPAVPVMQVLCLGAVFWPLHVINLNVLMAQGHSNLYFRLEVIKKLVGVGLLIVGASYGVMGIAWSQVAFGALAFVINARQTKLHLNYGPLAQLCDFVPVVALAAPLTGVIYWLGARLQLAAAPRLLSSVAFGALLFVALGWVFRLTALRDTIDLFRQRGPALV
jgi:teichuronic acid exporter